MLFVLLLLVVVELCLMVVMLPFCVVGAVVYIVVISIVLPCIVKKPPVTRAVDVKTMPCSSSVNICSDHNTYILYYIVRFYCYIKRPLFTGSVLNIKYVCCCCVRYGVVKQRRNLEMFCPIHKPEYR